MDSMNVTLTPDMLAVVASLMLLLQVLKATPLLAGRTDWIPPIAMVLGIAAAIALGMGATIASQIYGGSIMGLTACGAYNVAKLPGKLAENKDQVTP